MLYFVPEDGKLGVVNGAFPIGVNDWGIWCPHMTNAINLLSVSPCVKYSSSIHMQHGLGIHAVPNDTHAVLRDGNATGKQKKYKSVSHGAAH